MLNFGRIFEFGLIWEMGVDQGAQTTRAGFTKSLPTRQSDIEKVDSER